MQHLKTNIIPQKQQFYSIDDKNELDKKAICIFMALGFFLDTDTYWKNKKVLRPASNHTIDSNGFLQKTNSYFKWHYSPRKISFSQALDEFSKLFEQIIHEQTNGKKVILPLSGGLDSRTQAAALLNHPNVQTYSYAFKNGYQEHNISKKIAQIIDAPFDSFQVNKGYLWDCIEKLAEINDCYSEFTHPRQMAFVDKFKEMGDIFSLGHMGDLLFDTMHLPKLTYEQELNVVLKKTVKKGGLAFASQLWKLWGLDGNFESYLKERISNLLSAIKIDNTNAKIRAFKSMYSVPRWSSVNLSVFESVVPISLPYYDNRMCEFICTIPEEYLADRQLQIAYIQRKAPALAKITWQEQKPFHLNNYQWNKKPYNLPYKVFNKINREFNGLIGKPYVSRNWELQFVGKENELQLKKWLFHSGLEGLVPKKLIENTFTNFKQKDAVKYSHPLSMLLTLSVFQKKFNK